MLPAWLTRHGAGILLLFMAIPAPVWSMDDTLSPAANQSFAVANSKKPGVISLRDGLQYRILRSGFGDRPRPSDTVQIDYKAHLINGTVFDGSSPGLPVTLPLNNLLRGLNEALQLMHQGDRGELVIPPDLAFGTHSSPNGAVPPNQYLVFDVTLVSVIKASSDQAAQDGLSVSAMNRPRGTTQEQGVMLTIPQ